MKNCLSEKLRKDENLYFDVFDVSENQDITNNIKSLIPKLVLKPSAGGGSMVDIEDVENYIAFQKEWFRKNIKAPKDSLKSMTANGDSMEPTIRNGDMLLVDVSQNQAKTDNIYIIRIDDCLVVKRVQCILDNKLQIVSDNKNYDSYQIDLTDGAQDIKIIGKVVWYGRSIGVE